jgi:glucose/arabinose dehydrogenase
VKEGAFYGWPYAYFGKNEDPRHKGVRPDLVAKSVAPGLRAGRAHGVARAVLLERQDDAPRRCRAGAFVGQRGSWNRSEMSGYRVLFVPFEDGKPTGGPPTDVLAGFVSDPQKREAYGRPVGVTMMPDGALLVCDDAGNTVWRVSAAK